MGTTITQETTPAQQTIPTHRSHHSIAVIASSCVACAALATAAVIAVVHTTNSAASTPAASAAASAPATPVSPSHPVTPPVHPSAAVMTLQRELGQLNYYQGPDDGIMGPQTIAAIKYLQRDAHLPQTGVMNAATSAALANFLAHGNNQMGGNS